MINSSKACCKLITHFDLVISEVIQFVERLGDQGRDNKFDPGGSGLLIDHSYVVASRGVQRMGMGST